MDCEPAKIAKSKKRSVWSELDTQVLLVLWSEHATDLRRAKRNRHIYQQISLQMNNKFSQEEVRVKIRNFTQRYRDEKKEMGSSGGSPSSWKHYNAVHQIIGGNAANNAEVMETFVYENAPGSSSQPSPASQSLSSPVLPPSPSLPNPPFDITLSSESASPSSGKKRNHLGDVVELVKEQNEMLKSVVEESKLLSNEIVKALREQTETSKEFINLMKTLIEKI